MKCICEVKVLYEETVNGKMISTEELSRLYFTTIEKAYAYVTAEASVVEQYDYKEILVSNNSIKIRSYYDDEKTTFDDRVFVFNVVLLHE